MHAQVQEI